MDDQLTDSGTKSKKSGVFTSWFLAVVLGVLVHVAFLLFVHFETPVESELELSNAYIRYPNISNKKENRILREFSLLFDSEPLFLRTQWNVSSRISRDQMSEEEKTSFFGLYPPEWIVSDSLLLPKLENNDSLTKADDMLKNDYWDMFDKLGQRALDIKKIEKRSAVMEIFSLQNGLRKKREILTDVVSMADTEILLEPVIFHVLTDEKGLIGDPLLIQGSGDNAIDAALLEYLKTPFLFSALSSDYYKVIIGP